MSNRLLGWIAFAFLAAFLWILASKVGRIDLGILCALTLALAAWDLLTQKEG